MRTPIMLVALALGLFGCSDSLPTAAIQSTPVSLRPEQVTAIQAALADARDRVLPEFRDQVLAERVGRTLGVGATYLARDLEQFRGAMHQARAALEGAAGEDAPTVETLQLMIDLVEAAVAEQS